MTNQFLGFIVLFGAIQGFTFCVYHFGKRKENPAAYRAYFLFLFSLAFFNLVYTFLYFDVSSIGPVPVASFPFPYKYLFGVGLYFFVKHHFKTKEEPAIKGVEYLLFLPAVVYGCLRLYWYIYLHTGWDTYIFYNVYMSGFFTYNEFAYLFFNSFLGLAALRFLNRFRLRVEGSKRNQENYNRLRGFIYLFLGFTGLNLLHQLGAIAFNLEDSAPYYVVLLFTNSAYIYWIGFSDFRNSKRLFKAIKLKKVVPVPQVENQFQMQFEELMLKQQAFTNPALKISDLSEQLQTPQKQLSAFIQETYGMSFTEYMNHLRIEKVKTLLVGPESEKYTLIAIAEKAGFNSKSSFNATFKKVTGLTPTQYKAQHLNE